MRNSSKLVLLLATLAFAGSAAATPHQEGQSYVFLNVFSDHIEGRVEILYSDLVRAAAIPRIDAEDVTREFLLENARLIRRLVEERLVVIIDGDTASVEAGDLDVFRTGFGVFVMVNCEFNTALEGRPSEVEIIYDAIFDIEPNHRAFVVVQNDWMQGTVNNESSGALLLTPSSRSQIVDLRGGSVFTGFSAMLGLGVWHIWIGIDHILFLLALLLPAVMIFSGKEWLPAENFRSALWNVVAIVSMFTVAHTITLSLAALEVIQIDSRLVESIIALSIAFVALHNVFPIVPGKDWIIAFGFGLFHGFGFATVLGHLGVGREHAVLSLLAFNLGVEIGQVAVVCAIFPLLFLARTRRWYPRFIRYGSYLLIGVASFWFVERAFDIPLSQYGRRGFRRIRAVLGF